MKVHVAAKIEAGFLKTSGRGHRVSDKPWCRELEKDCAAFQTTKITTVDTTLMPKLKLCDCTRPTEEPVNVEMPPVAPDKPCRNPQ